MSKLSGFAGVAGLLVAATILSTACGVAHAQDTGEAAIAESTAVGFTRNFEIARIDTSLGSGTFESWLESVLGPETEIAWESNDCEEGLDAPPTCVTANCLLTPHGRVVVSMMISGADGNWGAPQFWWAEVMEIGPTEQVRGLADLRPTLSAARSLQRRLSKVPDKPLDDSTAIETVQRMPARDLDSRLPVVPLEVWVSDLAGPGAKVRWELEGCNRARPSIDTGGPEDYWACVEVYFTDARVATGFSLRVGTFDKGLLDTPKVTRVWLNDRRSGHTAPRAERLDDLPEILERIRGDRD